MKLSALSNNKAKGRLYVQKNETDMVALNKFATGETGLFPGNSLVYREKTAEDASFRLCFSLKGDTQ